MPRPNINANNRKTTPIPVVSTQAPIVNADGTVTRTGQLLLQQLQAPSATQGTHSARPDPASVPDGAIYVESDRGVAYYNYQGTWEHLAGTMWGTLNPDLRPTDLGVHDGGFDFRGTDQAREFIWSQTQWVEVTPVQYGTHAARPLPADTAEGVLYVEWDRGSVIYQNENGAWQYIAGTMWGTLSPDQRPTDLGVHDAGFDFRGTDQQREFIWSQSAWVEVTPPPATPQNLLLLASSTSNLTLTAANQSVPGANLTLTVAGTYLVIGVFDFIAQGAGDVNAAFIGELFVNGVANSGSAVLVAAAAGQRGTQAQQWLATAPAGAFAELQAFKTSGTGTSIVASPHTRISALWVSP
jgi:hypothetical protein